MKRMHFNFSLKGKGPSGRQYAVFKQGDRDLTHGHAGEIREPGHAADLAGAGETEDVTDFYAILLAASLESHPPGGKLLERIRREIRANDPLLVVRLVMLLGEQKHFRELSLFLSAELAVIHGRNPAIHHLPEKMGLRPEEVPAWLEHYRRAGSKRPRGRLRKSLTASLSRLDEYRYSRYETELQVKIRHMLCWLKPKAEDLAQEELFRKIIRNRISVRSDWRTEWEQLSRQSFDSLEIKLGAMRDKWKEGISSFRIGYLPLVENLEPILEAGVSGKVLRLVAEYLRHPAAIARSGVSPVRLLRAYRILSGSEQGGAGMMREALEAALLHCSRNVAGPGHGERVVMALDVSNSMLRPLNTSEGMHGSGGHGSSGHGSSGHGSGGNGNVGKGRGGLMANEVALFDLGILLAMLFASRGCQVQAGIIGNTWKKIQTPSGPILRAVDAFRTRAGAVGYAVNAHLLIESLLSKAEVVSRVMVFSDYRLWEHRAFNQPAGADLGMAWRSYRRLAPGAELILFDLSGSGSKPVEWLPDGVILVSGWDDRIFDVLDAKNKLK